MEEKAGGEGAGEDGDQHGDEDDADAGKYERQRTELHVPIFTFVRGAGRAKGHFVVTRRRFLVLSGALLASACSPIAQARPVSTPSAVPPLAAHPVRGIWPVQYRTAPQQVRDAYSWAATHENILQSIPCYCGCGSSGHQNNFDCFVSSKAADGWITMDLHGLNCGTCVSITLETAAMTARGLTVRQMRAAIDARWSATGPSTPTPLP